MEGVSTVPERDIPGESARRERGVSRRIREVRQRTPRWPKPHILRKAWEHEKPEPVKKTDPTKESTVTITPLPDEASKVVVEVKHILKGLAGPMSVGTGGDHEVEEGTGLLDGGATHPLQQGTSDEIKNAVQITVELAHGATQLYRNP